MMVTQAATSQSQEVTEVLQSLPCKDGDLVASLMDLIQKQRKENLILRSQVEALKHAKAEESPTCEAAPAAPPEPLLLDLTATPWVLWRDSAPAASSSSRAGRSDTDPSAGRLMRSVMSWSDLAGSPRAAASERRQTSLQSLRPKQTRFAITVEKDMCRQTSSDYESVGAKPSDGDYQGRRQSWVSRMEEEELLGTCPDNFEESQSQELMVPCLTDTEMRGHTSPKALISGSTICDAPLLVRSGLTIESNSAQLLKMQWHSRARAVLVVVKPKDPAIASTLEDLTRWLLSQGFVVVLEPSVYEASAHLRPEGPQALVRTFSAADQLEKRIDLVITVGGDGTLTWAVSLFPRAVPPILSLAAGSLGFLTPFCKKDWLRTLQRMLDIHSPRIALPVVCRMRLKVVIFREGQSTTNEVQCLNEVLVHRGQSGALAKLDVGVDGEPVTLVQGDGIILATPTGSTAYSLAAGGSMVHPAVPSILLTPVSPHSLSFRPALLPDSAVVTVRVSPTARCGAALTVDGKDICTLQVGEYIEVAASQYPVPTICRTTETGDWFGSIHEALQWNKRAAQK